MFQSKTKFSHRDFPVSSRHRQSQCQADDANEAVQIQLQVIKRNPLPVGLFNYEQQSFTIQTFKQKVTSCY